MITGCYGIIIAVKELGEAVEHFKSLLGVKPEYVTGYEARLTKLEAQGTDLKCMSAIYDFQSRGAVFKLPAFTIELFASSDQNSIVGRFLAKKGEGVLLVTLTVDDLGEAVDRLRTGGRRLVLEKSVPTFLGETNLVHPKSMYGVQFELFQPLEESNG